MTDTDKAGFVLVPREPITEQLRRMRDAFRTVKRGGIGGQSMDACHEREWAPELAAYSEAMRIGELHSAAAAPKYAPQEEDAVEAACVAFDACYGEGSKQEAMTHAITAAHPALVARVVELTAERDGWKSDAVARLEKIGSLTDENARLRGEVDALRLGPIERSDGLVTGRDYIPLPGGWELQTKGTGSTFRIVDTKSGDRLPIPDSPYLHETLERMAREIHGALVRIDGEKA